MASFEAEDPKKLKLYSYWRSSCSWRVRIALNLKELDYEYIPVNILKGENKTPEFLKLNPFGCVPVLVDGDTVIADSLAILLYLEDKFPQHPLLPQEFHLKALNYQAANLIGANMQPYQNLPILGYIKEKLGDEEMVGWVHRHLNNAFNAMENLLEGYCGKYGTGDEPFLADLFLAPQMEGAVTRFDFNLNKYALLSKLTQAYKEHPAFQKALPENQPDAPHK